MIAYRTQPWPRGRYKRYRSQRGCVRNAAMLARDHPDELTLVKGYALMTNFDLWAAHWWCVDASGGVVDPTWKNNGRAYVGVEEIDPVEHAKRTLGAGAWELELPDQIASPDLVPALQRAVQAADDESEKD